MRQRFKPFHKLLPLLASFFVSEMGGFLTNTVILYQVFYLTDGSKFWLGLSQMLFVGPLALGSFLGGAIGEKYNRKAVMMICESINLIFISLMTAFSDVVFVIVFLRAFVVFFAGIYNPSRLAIIAELVPQQYLQRANSFFTTTFCLFHTLSPIVAAWLYKYFGGVKEIFTFNIATYAIAVGLMFLLPYHTRRRQPQFKEQHLLKDIRDGFIMIWLRADLNALLKNFSLAGICLGIFFPTLLPFIAEIFHGGEEIFGYFMLSFGTGGILGGFFSPQILRLWKRGQVLVIFGALQGLFLLLVTQSSSLFLTHCILFVWGWASVILTTTYLNYIQINVSSDFQARAFSLYDQSISLNMVAGALIVSLVGNKLSAYELMTWSAGIVLTIYIFRLGTVGMKALYKMET